MTCPTGIDIRDGLQMECIHCTQCIDACDAVMDKVGKPRGPDPLHLARRARGIAPQAASAARDPLPRSRSPSPSWRLLYFLGSTARHRRHDAAGHRRAVLDSKPTAGW